MSESGKTELNGNSHHHEDGVGGIQQQLKGGADLGRQVSITLTPTQFEEMYLQPGVKSRGQSDNIKTFGNPTPLGIVCFLLTYSPTMTILMGFRGTTSASLLSLIGVYYLMGGMGMWVSGILEFIVGNTFPSLVFISFGSFWFSLAFVVDPVYNVQGTLGATGPAFNSAWGLYLIFFAVYVFFLAIAACKTNVALVVILTSVALTFSLLGATYFAIADGKSDAATLLVATGAVGFVATVAGYWLLLHLILASVEFPINVPLGDLSRFYKQRPQA
ncbi:hypothetical protein CBS101457_006483 [Exobasidium rhododendri]|nr:hypothetical protein CBS101457_006483 [Exobasidium rhododendri]